MRPVRWPAKGVPEARCEFCRSWLPVTAQFWRPGNLARCLACQREYKRLHEAGRRKDDILRELLNANQRMNYLARRPERLASNHRWKAAHKEHISAYNKAYRERHRAELAASARAYYAANREVILPKKRAYRRNKNWDSAA